MYKEEGNYETLLSTASTAHLPLSFESHKVVLTDVDFSLCCEIYCDMLLLYVTIDLTIFMIIIKVLQDKQKYCKRKAKMADISACLFRVTCNKISGILIHKN